METEADNALPSAVLVPVALIEPAAHAAVTYWVPDGDEHAAGARKCSHTCGAAVCCPKTAAQETAQGSTQGI